MLRATSPAGVNQLPASGQRITPSMSRRPATAPAARLFGSRLASGTKPRLTTTSLASPTRAGVNTQKPGPDTSPRNAEPLV